MLRSESQQFRGVDISQECESRHVESFVFVASICQLTSQARFRAGWCCDDTIVHARGLRDNQAEDAQHSQDLCVDRTACIAVIAF